MPLPAIYHLTLNSLGSYATNSGRHREVFPKPPLIAFKRCQSLQEILVRARLSNEEHGGGGADKKGCHHRGKSRRQVCDAMRISENIYSDKNSRVDQKKFPLLKIHGIKSTSRI